jgi:hypothetical protein
MQAEFFLGLADSDKLKPLMNEVYVDVFGKTIQERQSEQSTPQVRPVIREQGPTQGRSNPIRTQ